MNIKPKKFLLDPIRRQAAKLGTSGLHPRYMWDASTEKTRFWMLNSIFPKNSRGQSLHKAIGMALQDSQFIMHVGCGESGQAVKDLKTLGAKNLIGIDFRVPAKEMEDTAFIALDLTRELPIETGAFSGVLFGSYHFHYMRPQEQLHLLQEIDRISGPGSKGFLGPFFPQHLFDSPFALAYSAYKNPLFGFVKERSVGGKRWRLYRSRIASISTLTGRLGAKKRRGIRLPLFSFYDMGLRSISGKVAGNAKVKKDYRPVVPNEYFITFEK